MSEAEVVPLAVPAPVRPADGATTTIDGFEIGAILGSGSYGEVVAARDRETLAHVAIKTCRVSIDETTPFCVVRECCALNVLARAPHPHLLAARAWLFQQDARTYAIHLVMERMATDLFTLLYTHKACLAPLPLALHVARALSHLHAHGVLHCDIKPANILARDTGNPRIPHLVLADFGMARLLSQCSHTQAVALADRPARDIGSGPTHWYRAPELFFFEIARVAVPTACDVWAWGATAYELFRHGALYGGDDRGHANALPVLSRVVHVLGAPVASDDASRARAWPLLVHAPATSAVARFVREHAHCEPSGALATEQFAPTHACLCTLAQARVAADTIARTQRYHPCARPSLAEAIALLQRADESG